ncbi:hypothetical protein BKA70DRAFT_1429035 [Coprinopsis sp. MPI-PUGE-AT-0042]|nr:hypothetical protein BKA70DRAFT_1429035 [Coprinopsis sp. MPI-PUGE-AT-0042]
MTIPMGTDDDVLAAFAGNPAEKDRPDVASIDIWEVWMNSFMKEHLGWTGDIDATRIVRRGEKGVQGLVHFVEYFVTRRGVDGGLFEGKLTPLMDAMQAIVVTGSAMGTTTLLESVDADSPVVPNTGAYTQGAAISNPDESIWVDEIDNSPISDSTKPTSKTPPKVRCPGYLLSMPDSKATYDVYPLCLHQKLDLPWSIREIETRSMRIASKACMGKQMVKEGRICFHCQQLPEMQVLKNIVQ